MSKGRKDDSQSEVMAQGHSGISAPAQGATGSGEAIMLEDEEFARLTSLMEGERSLMNTIAEMALQMDDTKHQAREARRKRDDFCLALERKYNVQKGAIWELNIDQKAIVIKQKDRK